ncbi:MAG: hypothetical protein JST28_07115 [Acidobacteria bacterium]|nr:hypothetical protein [Acidobacteriota bacterium]
MKCNRSVLSLAMCAGLVVEALSLFGQQTQPQGSQVKQVDGDKPVDRARLHNPALWHDPGRIAESNLYFGQGGENNQPVPPFKFESEDIAGTNPKFNVRDSHGTKWRVKLGDEARPEVTASRLLWAVGYYADDDYSLDADVQGLQLTRGADMASDGHIVDARFEKKPEGQKKIGTWSWKDNPFTGTKEFNGLRVMMAVINNWDLKDENNGVYEESISGKDLLLVADVGATFGTNGLSWSKGRSKGDLDTFKKSKFITRKTEAEVDFATPAAPTPIEAPNLKQYVMRRELKWIGHNIPIADARWIGLLLKQLSHEQLIDAFRAGQFPPEEIEKYVGVVESRIRELAEL